MPARPKVPEFERLTRIVCHFPLNRKADRQKPNQIHVIREFIEYLNTSAKFDEENVVLICIDHPLDKNDAKLWDFVATLKREIQRLYKRYAGEKEHDVWIVVHAIDRLV